MMVRRLFTAILAVLIAGCGSDVSRPFNHSYGTLTVEGNDYHSALVIQHKADGIHVVCGFVSDAPITQITIGPDNSQNAPLQIIPSQGIIVRNGKKRVIADDGHVVWIVEGKTYEQDLVGFPLKKELKIPKEILKKPAANESLSN